MRGDEKVRAGSQVKDFSRLLDLTSQIIKRTKIIGSFIFPFSLSFFCPTLP